MKKALVIGMARSGISSAKLLREDGWQVIINDTRASIPGLFEKLDSNDYINALGKDPQSLFDGVELMVLSPAVNMLRDFVAQAKNKGIKVIGELELGYRYSKGDFLCITGTNGKTTSTALLGEMCKRSGRRTFVLGNIGIPLTQFARQTREGDLLVVETAALQLEGNVDFHAKAAAVCNISEDHLDRFLSMDYYIKVKSKIFDNQTSEDVAILNYDDPITRRMSELTPARILYFSRQAQVEEGVFLMGNEIIYRLDGQSKSLIHAEDVRIAGEHNLENAMLCSATALSQGIDPAAVADALSDFAGVEHRIEFVCQKNGVSYINDSKGTNPHSTIQAVRAMNKPTVIILGGYDKHSTFDTLFEEIKNSPNIKEIVLLGETAHKLEQYAKEAGISCIHICEKRFVDAVDMARDLAKPGYNVLLSPACASWDMFDSFEERGDAFKQIVKEY